MSPEVTHRVSSIASGQTHSLGRTHHSERTWLSMKDHLATLQDTPAEKGEQFGGLTLQESLFCTNNPPNPEGLNRSQDLFRKIGDHQSDD